MRVWSRMAVVGMALVAGRSAGEAAPGAPAGGLRLCVVEQVGGAPVAGVTVAWQGGAQELGPEGCGSVVLPGAGARVQVSAPEHLAVELEAPARGLLQVSLVREKRFEDSVEVSAASPAPEQPALVPLRPVEVVTAAGAGENVFRVLQTLPGVTAPEEFSGRLSVRGGEPDQNLTVLDGVEIYNPYRLFGLVSAFNPDTIERFELTAGAFSARYGDRLSSLLVVENRDGDASRAAGGSAALSLTDTNVVLEGRLPGQKPGSWLVTGRRTYYDLVASAFTEDDLPGFSDAQARLTWDPAPGHTLSLFALAGRESTDAVFEGDRPGEQGDFVTSARNELVSLAWRAPLGQRGTARTLLSAYRNTEQLDVVAALRDETRRSNAPGEDDGFSQAAVDFTRELEVTDLALRQELFWSLGRGTTFDAGAELHGLQTRVRWLITGDRNNSAANGSSVRGGSGLPDDLDSSRDDARAGAWLQLRRQMGRLGLEPGLRLDWSGVNGRTVLSPRLVASLALRDDTRLRLAGGLYTQSPGYEKLIQSDYFVDLTSPGRLDLAPARSWQALLGLERDLPGGLFARTEAYYKSFADLTVGRLETEAERLARLATYDFPAELRDELPAEARVTSSPVSEGRGQAYGLDVYLARPPASGRRLSGWVSYTLGQAERELYGRTLPFDYDRRHALSVVGVWQLSRQLELAATARYGSGFPYTPVARVRVSDVADAQDGDRDGNVEERVPELDPSGLLVYVADRGGADNLNTARLPMTMRLDLRLTFRPRGPAGRWSIYLDVINATNRDNAGAYETKLAYDPASDRPRVVEEPAGGLPFLPSLGVRFRF